MFLFSFTEEAQAIQSPPCISGSLSFTLMSVSGMAVSPSLSFWAIPSLFPFFLTPLSPLVPSLSSWQLGASPFRHKPCLRILQCSWSCVTAAVTDLTPAVPHHRGGQAPDWPLDQPGTSFHGSPLASRSLPSLLVAWVAAHSPLPPQMLGSFWTSALALLGRVWQG